MVEDREQRAAIAEAPIELMGRTFLLTAEADITFEQYGWLQNASLKAGLGEELRAVIEPKIDAIRSGEAELADVVALELSERILVRAFEGRAYLDVLAGLLIERGKQWSRADAEHNREFFAHVKGADIRKLHSVVIQCVIGLFLSGLVSTKTSPSSSDRKVAAISALAGISLRPKTTTAPAGVDGSESTEK